MFKYIFKKTSLTLPKNMLVSCFSKSSNIKKLALFGLGRAGGFHMNSVQQLGGVKLKWVVDPIEQIAKDCAESMDCKYHTDIDDYRVILEDPEVDGIIVSTPTEYHYDNI